jgi:hypothetical protein
VQKPSRIPIGTLADSSLLNGIMSAAPQRFDAARDEQALLIVGGLACTHVRGERFQRRTRLAENLAAPCGNAWCGCALIARDAAQNRPDAEGQDASAAPATRTLAVPGFVRRLRPRPRVPLVRKQRVACSRPCSRSSNRANDKAAGSAAAIGKASRIAYRLARRAAYQPSIIRTLSSSTPPGWCRGYGAGRDGAPPRSPRARG